MRLNASRAPQERTLSGATSNVSSAVQVLNFTGAVAKSADRATIATRPQMWHVKVAHPRCLLEKEQTALPNVFFVLRAGLEKSAAHVNEAFSNPGERVVVNFAHLDFPPGRVLHNADHARLERFTISGN